MFCPNCGKSIDDSSKFCLECGYKIDQTVTKGMESTVQTWGKVQTSSSSNSDGKSKLEAEKERRYLAAQEREKNLKKKKKPGRVGTEVKKMKQRVRLRTMLALLVAIWVFFLGYSIYHMATTGITVKQYRAEIAYKFQLFGAKTKLNVNVAFGGYGRGLNCKSIYQSYKKEMEKTSSILAKEYRTEADQTSKKKEELDAIEEAKLIQLAAIEEEGRFKMKYMADEWFWVENYDYDYWSKKLYEAYKEESLVVYRPYSEDLKASAQSTTKPDVSTSSDSALKNEIMAMVDEIEAGQEQNDTSVTTKTEETKKPADEKTSEQVKEQTPSDDEELPPQKEEKDSQSGAVDPDLKAFLDSYEAFVDEYVSFMKKYQSDPTNAVNMMNDYTRIMNQYADFTNKINKYNTKAMSKADLEYYLDVTNRCSKKMLSVY